MKLKILRTLTITLFIFGLLAVSVYAGTIENTTIGSQKYSEKRIWPSDAPIKTCYDAAHKIYSTTGENSATWFNYGGCGSWKVFDVTPKERIRIRISGDDCPGCVLGHLNFDLYERTPPFNNWDYIFRHDGPDWYGNKPANFEGRQDISYVPKSDKIKIYAFRGGFYIEVYRSSITKEKSDLQNLLPPIFITVLGLLLLFLQIKYQIFWKR